MTRSSVTWHGRLGLLALLLGGCAPRAYDAARTPPTEATAEGALAEVIADYERLDREIDPITAGQEDDLTALSRLPDVSPRALADYRERLTALRARLTRIEPRTLSEESALDHALLAHELDSALEGYTFDLEAIPFQTGEQGFHTLADYLARTTTLRTREDAEAWIARLTALADYYAQNVENAQRGIATGRTQPRLVVARVLEVAQAQASVPPGESVLLTPLATLPATVPAAEREVLQQRALALVRDRIAPAQREFVGFLERTYMPAARPGLGWRSTPGGEASYRYLVRTETTTSLTPEQIHQIGLAEVARIRAKMEDTIRASGFRGSFAEFQRMLRTDARFYATTPEALLEKASEIAKRADDRLPRLFGTLPRLPYGVRPVPRELAEGATTGRYWPGSPQLGQAGAFIVNTSRLDQRPLYELPALTLHEAVPGHHLQIALAQERTDLPYFRRNALYTAFVEGWGLYAESLGEELGLYRDAYESFGRSSYEMWRACRLVADTGIHWLGWDLEQARRCFSENTALAPHNIQTELERYVSWPAQALAYKVGELRLRALRTRAEQALGPRFDVRRFHDLVLLGGALPLDVLERRVDAFIASEQQVAPAR